jgi:outer membrane protein
MYRTLTIILIFITSQLVFTQKALTLNNAIQIALERNPDLQKSKNNISSYESGVLASYGNFLPSLSAGGNFSWSRTQTQGSTINIGGSVIQLPASTSQSRSYNADVSSNLTIFDGLSNFAQLSQSKNNLEAARLTLARTKQDIVFQTISLYYDVISAEQLLKVKQEDVAWNKKNLETIEEQSKLGSATLADLYAQQVQEGQAELAFVQAQNSLETSKGNLLYYLGLNVLENYQFPDSLTQEDNDMLNKSLDVQFDSLSELVDEALNNRPDYLSAKYSLESAYNGITIARSGDFPILTGNGAIYGSANNISDVFRSKTYSLGISLDIPIFSGFSVSNQVQAAEVNAQNQELDLSNLKRQIEQNIQKNYLDLQAAKTSLSVSEQTVKAAKENLSIQSEKYKLGSSRLLDVLEASSNYTSAQSDYISAQFSFITLSEQLKYLIGTLDYQKFEQ